MDSNENALTKGFRFEREVAAIFRSLGAKVEHDVALAGSQIDIFISEKTSTGIEVKSIIECKSYSKSVGIDVVTNFGSISYLLKNRGLIDRSIIVSLNGFTRQAKSAAKEYGIELLEIADLQQRVKGKELNLKSIEDKIEIEDKSKYAYSKKSKKVFVIMPFSKEFDDVYILGIRDVAENLGLIVERADSIEHNEQILDIIKNSIKNCDIVIADTTYQNPNVFYEIGFSHAINKPTVLITRDGQDIPFDLKSMNHIFYNTIVDLRDRLKKRLQTML